MSRHPRIQPLGEIYHVTARGNAKEPIFLIPEDWERFLDILRRIKSIAGFELLGYCLMPNHIHLIIRPLVVLLSNTMSAVLNRYARYINHRRGRIGHVFQERYGSRICGNDTYLLQLARYVHLNPVKAGLISDPAQWQYSSHLNYLGLRQDNLVDPGSVLALFGKDICSARPEYLRFVQQGMSGLDNIKPDEESGDDDSDMIDLNVRDAEVLSLDAMAADYAAANNISIEVMRGSSRNRNLCRARDELKLQAFRSGFSLTEIAGFLNVSVPAISKALSKIRIS
ncbi:MAG: transposase [Elusimicrobiota bacterium]|jgi:REP element-mobilizing transposase RayT